MITLSEDGVYANGSIHLGSISIKEEKYLR